MTAVLIERAPADTLATVRLNRPDKRNALTLDMWRELEQAFALMPDLVLMDLSLPGMDGWEATRQLKSDERTRHIPVVALTGHALAGASEGAKRAGCDSFVTKPCLPDDLVVEVRRMLSTVKNA